VALPKEQGWQLLTLKNTPEGIRSLQAQLPPNAHCILEATGSYSVLVSYLLTQAGVDLSVVNPKQSHHFAKMQLSITKTDNRDAVLLAEYGRVFNPPLYQMSSDNLLKMKQKRTLIRQYKKQRTVLVNLQESFAPLPIQDTTSQSSLQTMLAHFETAITQLSGEINQLCQDDFNDQFKRLTSIKGISTVTASALIEITNGFRDFSSAKALAKFIGIAPVIYQSGKTGLTQGICKTGDPYLRSLLYMASWSAIRYNKACREFYERLKTAGKPSKVALIAVCNKLLRQAFAVVRFGQDYDPDYKPVFRTIP
jgi:transposase